MMSPTAIERIHDAARAARGKSLDRRVYLDNDLGLYGLVDLEARQTVYVDVPVVRIVALGRRDFWSPGDTWRTITYHLQGEGWSSAVFDYFESQTKEEHFPAPNSRYQLRLLVYGGVAECGNGNHRLIAARAWLTDKYGDGAVLRGVRVSVFPIHRCVVDFLKRAVCEGSDVLTATLDHPDREYWRVDGKRIQLLLKSAKSPYEIYAWVDDQVVLLKDERTFLQRRFPQYFSPVMDRYGWRTVPLAIVEELLDDSWLTPQLETAETWS